MSTTRPLTITWSQVSAAFDTLYSLCVDGPVAGSRGGVATYSTNPMIDVFGGKRKKGKRTQDFNGLNALPDGAIINLWKHGDRVSLGCELSAVLRGQSLDDCTAS